MAFAENRKPSDHVECLFQLSYDLSHENILFGLRHYEQAAEFLKITDDPENRPAFIHCQSAARVAAFWMIRRALHQNAFGRRIRPTRLQSTAEQSIVFPRRPTDRIKHLRIASSFGHSFVSTLLTHGLQAGIVRSVD